MKFQCRVYAVRPGWTATVTAVTAMALLLLANLVFTSANSIVLSLIEASTTQHTLQAEYVLRVELNRYHSNSHLRVDGFCCETLDHVPCSMECDNRFLFCLQLSNQSMTDVTCPLGSYSTGNISRDSATFATGEDLDEGVPNPMVFKGPTWPVSTQHNHNSIESCRVSTRP